MLQVLLLCIEMADTTAWSAKQIDGNNNKANKSFFMLSPKWSNWFTSAIRTTDSECVHTAKYFVLTALVGPTDLYYLKSNPALTKTFFANKMQERPALTDSTKDNGEVVELYSFTEVKLFHIRGTFQAAYPLTEVRVLLLGRPMFFL
jgi:hypothetical protein